MKQNYVNNNPTVEEILRRYSDMVYRLAYAKTMNRYDAEDIMQDVFIKYMKHAHELKEEEHRKAWLITVTVNTTKTFLTSAWNRKKTTLEETYEIPDDKNPFLDAEEGGVLEVVSKLPEKYRVVIHLFYYEELSIKEICDVLKMKESTVKSQLYRARELLKDQLKKEEFDV